MAADSDRQTMPGGSRPAGGEFRLWNAALRVTPTTFTTPEIPRFKRDITVWGPSLQLRLDLVMYVMLSPFFSLKLIGSFDAFGREDCGA